jgi:hypothetical protein
LTGHGQGPHHLAAEWSWIVGIRRPMSLRCTTMRGRE